MEYGSVSAQTSTETSAQGKGALRALMLSNIPVVVGLLAVLVYIELRVPAEIFYSKFGVSPTDAGFGSIDSVLQQSTRVLVIYALIGAAWALAYFVLLYPLLVSYQIRRGLDETGGKWKIWVAAGIPIFGWGLATFTEVDTPLLVVTGGALMVLGLFLPRALFRDAEALRKTARRQALGWSRVAALGGVAFGAMALLFVSIIEAGPNAAAIKSGSIPTDGPFPWHVHRVSAHWTVDKPPMYLPGCRFLTYLGHDNGRVLLYDRKGDRTLAIGSAHLELSFPDDC